MISKDGMNQTGRRQINYHNVSGSSNKIGSAVALLTITSFLIQFFNRVIGSYAPYRIFLSIALILLITSKRTIKLSTHLRISSIWIPMLVVVAGHLILNSFTISYAMDLYTYFIGVVFVAACGDNSSIFNKAYKVIIFFASMYAISVLIQLIIPPIYSLYLQILPAESVSNIQRYRSSYGMLTGFSTNPGFTAGHIVAGIIALFSIGQSSNKKNSIIHTIGFLVLISALLLTGKRGHLLGVIFTCILTYLISNRGKKRLLAVNLLLIGIVILIPLLFLFSDVISSIPALNRVADMFVGLVNGEDVTNGRSRLFAFALLQFRENPIFGIGWGQYRSSIIGNVTLRTELDTHNIYLQLLCETGIVGFSTVVIPMFVFIRRNIKNLSILNKEKKDHLLMKRYSLYSLGYQLFFVLYGISGNPLYDYNYVIMFFISCAITATVYRNLRRATVI